MIDFDSLALSQVFGHLAYPATFNIDGVDYAIAVLDHTRGITVGDDITVSTIIPAVGVKYTDLDAAGLTPDQFIGATVEFKGMTYVIRDSKDDPIPNSRGQIYFFLRAES